MVDKDLEFGLLMKHMELLTYFKILTVKSDDVVGVLERAEAIVKEVKIYLDQNTESFKVLIKELQSLYLDIKSIN